MIELWMGDKTYKSAIVNGELKLVGPTPITKNISSWIRCSNFEGIAPAKESPGVVTI